jgi:hypothetical protein
MLELSPGEFLLVKLRTPKHLYGPDAQAIADPEGEGYLRVIPAMLRDQVTYLHHYSSMACHAAPQQMWAEMQRAGYCGSPAVLNTANAFTVPATSASAPSVPVKPFKAFSPPAVSSTLATAFPGTAKCLGREGSQKMV